jgi:hypothetical protein
VFFLSRALYFLYADQSVEVREKDYGGMQDGRHIPSFLPTGGKDVVYWQEKYTSRQAYVEQCSSDRADGKRTRPKLILLVKEAC